VFIIPFTFYQSSSWNTWGGLPYSTVILCIPLVVASLIVLGSLCSCRRDPYYSKWYLAAVTVPEFLVCHLKSH
jgi:hypothetical protein